MLLACEIIHTNKSVINDRLHLDDKCIYRIILIKIYSRLVATVVVIFIQKSSQMWLIDCRVQTNECAVMHGNIAMVRMALLVTF